MQSKIANFLGTFFLNKFKQLQQNKKFNQIKSASLFSCETDSFSKYTIASENLSAIAKSIDNALGKTVPVLIGFLASLLGIGGLADKVLNVIRKIRQRIENAIVKFWTFVKGKAGKLLSKIGIGGKDKKEKKVQKRTNAEMQKDLDEGVNEGTQLLKDNKLTKRDIEKRLEIIRENYELKELKIVTDKVEKDGKTVHIHGEVNPKKEGTKLKIKDAEDIELELGQAAIIKETDPRHFKAILPNHVYVHLTTRGKDIELELKSLSKGEANVENKDSYVIVNVDPERVNNFKSKDSSQFKKLYNEYAKKKYGIGTVDCFTFAMDFLNNKLKGDLKQKPQGEDNDERFEDLKKDKN